MLDLGWELEIAIQSKDAATEELAMVKMQNQTIKASQEKFKQQQAALNRMVSDLQIAVEKAERKSRGRKAAR